MSLLSLAKLPLIIKFRIVKANFLLTSAIASATQIHGFRNGGDRYINVNIHHPQADINCKVRAEILIIESLCELDLASGSDCTDTCAFFKSLASLKWVGHFMKKILKSWFTHHGTDSERQSEVKKIVNEEPALSNLYFGY